LPTSENKNKNKIDRQKAVCFSRHSGWQVGNRHLSIKAGGWQEGAGRRKIHK